MIVGEYGIVFNFCVNFNLSSWTSLNLIFTKPSGTSLIVTNPEVSLGTVDIITNIQRFSAYTYVVYVFASGNVDQAGTWKVRLEYEDATPRKLISTTSQFSISPVPS